MSTKQSTVDYILEQVAETGNVSEKKMFGEYGLYCDGKLVALVCDDQLFIKPTEDGKAFIGNYTEKSPYANAKPYLYISGEKWDDREWLTQLLKITTAQVPLPKPKPKRTKGVS